MKQLFSVIRCLLLFCAFQAFAGEVHPTGTLIVTYQTGTKGERLDRIRFWIRNERQEQHMYPKGSAYVDDTETMTRMVVIEDLPPGNYSLEFLVPNTDNLFNTIPLREFTVTPRNVVKIAQQIKPRYASLKAQAIPQDKRHPFSIAPAITLKDQYGKIQAQSAVGKLMVNDLSPGDYTVIFENLNDYDTPNPVTVALGPSEAKGPVVGKYKKAKARKETPSQYALEGEEVDEDYYGHGVIDTDNPVAIDNIIADSSFEGGISAGIKLPPNLGCERVYPTISVMNEKGQIAGRSSNGSLIIENLCPGEYSVLFGDLEGCIAPEKQVVTIKPGERVGPIQGEYTLPTGKLLVRFESHTDDTPLDIICFTLKDKEGHKTAYPQVGRMIQDPLTGGKLVVIQCLKAGDYCLEFLDKSEENNAEPLAIHDVQIRPNRTQTIHQVFEKMEPEKGSASVPETKQSTQPNGDEIAQKTIIINTPEYPYESYGYVTVNSNMPEARWTLYDSQFKVTTGSGASSTVRVRTGSAFHVKPERINGYDVEVRPSGRFSLLSGDSFAVDIHYTPTVGYIEIHTQLSAGQFVQGEIVSEDERDPIIPFKMMSDGKTIKWRSPGLLTGYYMIHIKSPQGFEPVEAERIKVVGKRTVYVRPKFVTMGSIRVLTNIPEATYTLRSDSGDKEWRGHGNEFLFTELPEGQYTVEFSSKDSKFYTPPESKRVFLGKSREVRVRARYEIGGELQVVGNINRFQVKIEEVYGKHRTWEKNIFDGTEGVYLPEGRYRLTFQPLVVGMDIPKPMQVIVKPLQTKEITILFPQVEKEEVKEKKEETVKIVKEKQTGTVISSNIPEAVFLVKDLRKNGKTRDFSGTYVNVPLEPEVEYEVKFSDVPGYTTPLSKKITVKKGEKGKLTGSYYPKGQLQPVAAGNVTLGGEGTNVLEPKTVSIPEFSIGTYEVTNEEFAFWLNNAHRDGKIKYYIEGDRNGAVVDNDGHILFQTEEGDNRSQITAFGQKMEVIFFSSLPDRQKHPVNYVSWYGAKAYCDDNGYRLPTEAEWEMAAGMSIEKPSKKYVFGFGQDEIDHTWANYKLENDSEHTFSTRTSEVGFYNGLNMLPLMMGEPEQKKTHDAKSPVGAYDMSGNLWEWTADWYAERDANYSFDDPKGPSSGTKKVAKGGCFDSTAEGVRVAERIGLSPDHLDEFTGFRVAKD